MIKKKKGLSLSDAPTVVMIVGFVFLLLATTAFISNEYRDSMDNDNSHTVTNETINATGGDYVDSYQACGFNTFAVTAVYNYSDGVLIGSGNYTATASSGLLANATDTEGISNLNWNVTYTYLDGGEACNITTDLETEISDNTSIAGIILTIALIGIILTILIGVFVTVGKSRGKRI